MVILLAAGTALAAPRDDGKNQIYSCTALTGGTAGTLDALDITGAGNPNTYDLITGDGAIVMTATATYFYRFDSTATDAESAPGYIRPDDYATAGVWERVDPYIVAAAESDPIITALYNANTVIIATVDDTPAALEIGEQKVLGRATGGNITALDIDSDLADASANDDTVPSAKATKAVLDVKESSTSNDIDPDRLAGDATDDNLLDPSVGGAGADTSAISGVPVLTLGVVSAAGMGDLPTTGTWAPTGTLTLSGATVIRPQMSVELADTEDITETYMRYDVIFYDGAGVGQIDIDEQISGFECSFEIQNRSASALSVGWEESGANPYLNDTQVGADNEMDIAAGAYLRCEVQDRSGNYEWRCYMTWGTTTDGGADD
jgi:hypothetical protein